LLVFLIALLTFLPRDAFKRSILHYLAFSHDSQAITKLREIFMERFPVKWADLLAEDDNEGVCARCVCVCVFILLWSFESIRWCVRERMVERCMRLTW
jgi:hypothetical protein